MRPAERRVRLRRRLRDRRDRQLADSAAQLDAVADAYDALGRPELAEPYRESAALFHLANAAG